MYCFRDYKNLDRNIRAVATRYWAECIRQRLGAKCANQILAAHIGPEQTSTPGWSDNSSRFWNRALKGHPVGHESKIDHSEQVVPGSRKILLHPIWQLFGATSHGDGVLLKVVQGLPSQLHATTVTVTADGKEALVVKIQQRAMRNLIEHPSLDSLTLLLALAKRAQANAHDHELNRLELFIVKIFFRLATRSEVHVIADDLYRLMSELLEKTMYDPWVALENRLPTNLAPLERISASGIANHLNVTLDALASAGIIGPNDVHKDLLLDSIDHTNSKNLVIDLLRLASGVYTRNCIGQAAESVLQRYKRQLHEHGHTSIKSDD